MSRTPSDEHNSPVAYSSSWVHAAGPLKEDVVKEAKEAMQALDDSVFEISVAEWRLQEELRRGTNNDNHALGGTGRRPVAQVYQAWLKDWPTSACPIPTYFKEMQFAAIMKEAIGLPGEQEQPGERQKRARTVERRANEARQVYNNCAKILVLHPP